MLRMNNFYLFIYFIQIKKKMNTFEYFWKIMFF